MKIEEKKASGNFENTRLRIRINMTQFQPQYIPFSYGRGRGIVWVCDVEGSTQYLADPEDAGQFEEFLTRFMWVAQCLIAATRGELVKFTGDGFLGWFELPLHRDLPSKTHAVLQAIWHTSFLVNVTQLGLKPKRKFHVRHGLAYEQDALFLKNSHPGNNAKDIIGEAVGRAFRLSEIPAKFPGVAAEIQFEAAIESFSPLGAFRRKKLSAKEVLRYFKGRSLGVKEILVTVQAPSQKKNLRAVHQNATEAIAKASGTSINAGKDSEFIERFASMFLKGPEWTRTVWELETTFIRENLFNSLKEIIPLLEKLKKEKE